MNISQTDIPLKNSVNYFIPYDIIHSIFSKTATRNQSVILIDRDSCVINIFQCVFKEIESSLGTCCIILKSCNSFISNTCFSDITTSYVSMSYVGGSCLFASQVSADLSACSIVRACKANKKTYGTVQLISCVGNIRSINQSDGQCEGKSNFANMLIFEGSSQVLLNDCIVADIANGWSILFASSNLCTAQRIIFTGLSTDTSILKVNEALYAKIDDCICVDCTGLIINSLSDFYLKGWYSDQELSPMFINVVISPNNLIFIHPECFQCSYTLSKKSSIGIFWIIGIIFIIQ